MKEVKEEARQVSGEEVQADGTASAKALRQECLANSRTIKPWRPVGQQQSEGEGKQQN